jgi:hypothetical protein
MQGLGFESLVAEVADLEESVDRILDWAPGAMQTRLRWNRERVRPCGDGLPRTRVVFLHIMRTGGTSLSTLGSAWSDRGRSRVHLFVDDLLFMPRPLLAQLSFIAGHIPYEALETIPPPFRTITVIREPVGRALSHYFALRRSSPAYRDITLDEFASNDAFATASTNYQARQLAHRIGIAQSWISYSPDARLSALNGTTADRPVQALFDSTPIELPDDDLLATAREHLGAIDAVGVTENLETVATRVAGWFGGSLDSVPHLHRTSTVEATELSGSVRKKLEARNQIDRELYEQAASMGNASAW